MKFERLRLAGFKTFVEPVEISIAPGLTGVVGPNGCGKSNLVEALRWAMGETSSKSLRGAGMDDVIFAGSATRPARDEATVSLRVLAAGDGEAETLEISRKIVRDQGSSYRINGREVRARDVQVLFADAASGARSPSMVRQGQISEIINAKPQHRRRILEDAAGVAGLHTRRHEAELRLGSTEENLARLSDILAHYERQRTDLKRQARQAERYGALAARLRANEIALLCAGLASAQADDAEARAAHEHAIRAKGRAMIVARESEQASALAQFESEAAREAHGQAQAGLTALNAERAALEAALSHIETRLAALAQRRDEAAHDQAAQAALLQDAEAALSQLAQEEEALAGQLRHGEARLAQLERERAARSAARAKAEVALASHQSAHAEASAQRRAAEQRLHEAEARCTRLTQALQGEQANLPPDSGKERLVGLDEALAQSEQALEASAIASSTASEACATARQQEQGARERATAAERMFQRLETEARTLAKIVAPTQPGLWTPALDRIRVSPGFETALAAALGEDLDAAIEPGAPRHWAERPPDANIQHKDNIRHKGLPPLPPGATPLLDMVEAPGALHARLAQIGVVAPERGETLAAQLAPGQRLVSMAGDLWRWDGYASRAEAPAPAARRLLERNRLAECLLDTEKTRLKRDEALKVLSAAMQKLHSASEAEASAREANRRAQTTRDSAARALEQARKGSEDQRMQEQAHHLRLESLSCELDEAARQKQAAEADCTALPPPSDAGGPLALALSAAREAENAMNMAQAQASAATSAARARSAAMALERAQWHKRLAQISENTQALEARRANLAQEAAELEGQPDALSLKRLKLLDATQGATQALQVASDTMSLAQGRLRNTQDAARLAQKALAEAQTEAVRLEAKRDNTAERLTQISRAVEVKIEGPISALPPLTDPRPPEAIEAEVLDLRSERDRLGPVNLRAAIELCEIEKEHTRLARERADVEQAILTLRRAIEGLNAEGRARLHAAFERVNVAFSRLFNRLFGGGSAELQLVEAQDPLEAGLEILAHPPGKKPQLLSLLSGGEQALTATALIFAVFLTNPSPICVLDELDAPLDDANVERLCDLLGDMARETETRFLVITHNPITMARMNRLFGVTMLEKGVSQVVSVDLPEAARFADAR